MAHPIRTLITIATVITIVIAIAAESESHELRPSDHGLEFQYSPPSSSSQAKASEEMRSFFGGDGGSPKGSSPTSGVALPKAMNSSDPAWLRATGRGGAGGGRQHVRRVMLWASVGCGIAGVALLLASGFLYIQWRKKERRRHQQPSSSAASMSSPPPQQPFFDK